MRSIVMLPDKPTKIASLDDPVALYRQLKRDKPALLHILEDHAGEVARLHVQNAIFKQHSEEAKKLEPLEWWDKIARCKKKIEEMDTIIQRIALSEEKGSVLHYLQHTYPKHSEKELKVAAEEVLDLIRMDQYNKLHLNLVQFKEDIQPSEMPAQEDEVCSHGLPGQIRNGASGKTLI